MLGINPQEIFPIVRGITDHTDQNTYYVRAVIKNAKNGVVIDTVDLIDNGDRYFSYNWQVPADVSGQGFFISITTSIYTDAEHTTKSSVYFDEFDTYLVAQRPNANLLGGGGADISYKKIKEIIAEEVKKLDIKIPPVDLSIILDEISAIKHDYNGINQGVKALLTKEITETDLSVVLSGLDDLKAKFEALIIPKFDLKPALEKSDEVVKTIKEILSVHNEDIKKSIIQERADIIAEKKAEEAKDEKTDAVSPWYREKIIPRYRIK